jgi:hypothetical protein
MGTPMRLAAFCAMVWMLALPAAQPDVRFYPVALDYAADPASMPAAIESDLRLVNESSFNSIRTTVRWADAEPAPGEYAFTALKRVIEGAHRAGLQVIVRIDHTPPSWILKRYADTQRQTPAGKGSPAPCVDHPGARAGLGQFVQTAATRARSFGRILSFEVGRPLTPGVCVCPCDDLIDLVTRTREAVTGADVSTFVDVPTIEREWNGRPAQGEWLASRHLDRVGVTIDASAASSARLGLALDDIGSVGKEGWWLAVAASVTERDRRFVTWAAIARGASGLIYEDPPDRSLVTTIARNPALFASVRPRRAGDVRVEGSASVDVRVLESRDVQMIVGLNHAETAQRATMTFPRETQEAIWQNMETGASVNFIAGASGPSYTYWFRPKDAFVLMIRKDIR